MEATITYTELADHIESHYKVKPNINYVDGKTVKASYRAARFLLAYLSMCMLKALQMKQYCSRMTVALLQSYC